MLTHDVLHPREQSSVSVPAPSLFRESKSGYLAGRALRQWAAT